MSRRSWSTLRNTQAARRAEDAERTTTGPRLTVTRSFATRDVKARLDAEDARDRAEVEARLAARPRVDLGDDEPPGAA